MSFRYSCFISYCHGQHELIKGFIEQLKAALKAYLEPLLDEEVYIDEERLKPGYKYNEALARAICESVCMIVVYSPRYERHAYCGREFTAMELLEQRREAMLAGVSKDPRGLIIPIIFRGAGDLPKRLTEGRHYVDFSQFTLATADISSDPRYIQEVQRIAEVIYEHYCAFEQAGTDPCKCCDGFALPPEDAVPKWRPAPKPVSPPLPGREV